MRKEYRFNFLSFLKHPDFVFGSLVILFLPYFSIEIFKQPLTYVVEVLFLHLTIALSCVWVLRCISRRYLFSFSIPLVVIFLVGFVSQTKQAYLDAPLFPWDFLLAPQMLYLWQAYTEVLLVLGCMAAIVLLALILLRVEIPQAPRPWGHAVCGCVLMMMVATGAYKYFSPGRVQNIAWEQKANYSKHGYLLGLLLNVKSLWLPPPSVSSEEVAHELGFFEHANKAVMSDKPDVIVILSESYTSLPELFGVEAESCFSDFRTAGSMTTSQFGGFTADVEFELLTGYPVNFFPARSSLWEMYAKHDLPDALPFQF